MFFFFFRSSRKSSTWPWHSQKYKCPNIHGKISRDISRAIFCSRVMARPRRYHPLKRSLHWARKTNWTETPVLKRTTISVIRRNFNRLFFRYRYFIVFTVCRKVNLLVYTDGERRTGMTPLAAIEAQNIGGAVYFVDSIGSSEDYFNLPLLIRTPRGLVAVFILFFK